MFDDQSTGGSQSTVPPNLPIGEPEDMFSRTPDIDGDASLVSDMPPAAPLRTESAPSALDAGILKPKEQMPMDDMNIDSGTEEPLPFRDAGMPSSPASFPSSAVAPQAPMNSPRMDAPQMPPHVSVPPQLPQDDMYRMKDPTLSRGIMTGIVMIIVLLIVGGGGWWIYRSFIAPAKTTSTTNNPFGENTVVPPVTNTTVPISEEESGLNEPVSADDMDTTVLFGEPIDSDGDGLDDTRESSLQTDANNWDSDSDDLSDGDEVIIWKTNPLVADTDGDTYFDGAEVKAGYNPAGPGKIFEPPAAASGSNTSRLNEAATTSSTVDVTTPVAAPTQPAISSSTL